MISLFNKTISGLVKTRSKISNLFARFAGKTILDESDLEELEEELLTADIGWELTETILKALKVPNQKEISRIKRFEKCVSDYLKDVDAPRNLKKVILLVGINGTGKTTSAAKLGAYYSQSGESVSLVAADTYRAAAIEQIRIWSERLKLQLISNEKSADPASVAYDGVFSGLTKGLDKIIVDTSGRVHNSSNLMKELEKIYRVVVKLTHEVDVLMAIDANTGQNALQQATEFSKYIPLTGVILTKMDGTARGGIAIQIMKELNLPIYFMGIGEKAEDLIPFDCESYIKGLIIAEKECADEE
jgi:fused signal recognition particle receptor